MKKNAVNFFLLFTLLSCAGTASGLAFNPAAAEPVLEKVPDRPNADEGPTRVEVGIWVIDIDSINSAAQNFVTNFFVVLKWHDPRLAHGRKSMKRYNLEDVWSPQIMVANEIGIVRKTLPDSVEVKGDGTVLYRQRYVGPLSQPLDLRKFPFDQHLFRIHLMATAADKDDIEFVPGVKLLESGMKDGVGIASDISLPDWTVVDYSAKAMPYRINEQFQFPGYALEFIAARDSRYFIWKVILPLILIVAMSWTAFWIDPKEIGTNVTAVMTSMLTLVAYRFTFENYIPNVGYLTRIDKFMMWSTLLVFFSMMHVAANSFLVYRGRHEIARLIDLFARVIYPLVFFALTFSAFCF